jgi:hypothetical protein
MPPATVVLVVLLIAGATLLVAKRLLEPLAWRAVRTMLTRELVQVGLRYEQAKRMAESNLRRHGWEAWW